MVHRWTIADVLDRTDLRALLDEYAVPDREGRRWHCPLSNHEDHHASVTMHRDHRGHERWRCWSGDRDHRGDAIDLVQAVRLCDRATAIEELAARRIPHVVVSFGNPYLIREFPNAQAYLLGWSDAAVSQRAAADALFGDRAILGRMPTAVPPLYGIGDGIQLPAKSTGGR